MKNHSTFLLRFFTLLVPLGLLAQELPTIIPPSPEAASLGKFTEVPISHYTGVPNISVPITSFRVGDKNFPVSLSYHARGVKVDEIASRVGLGWALNAGGQISRQIRNKADDGLTGYITAANAHANAFFNNNYNFAQAIEVVNSQVAVDWQPDMIPDVFSLQVNDISSKFMFNYADLKPILQKYDDIIVEGSFTNGNIGSFTVTDKDGYIYQFGMPDMDTVNRKYTFQSNSGGYILSDPLDGTNMATEWSAFAYPNTWHLISIKSPNGDRADFIYNKEINYVYRRTGDKFNFGVSPQDQLHNNTDLVRMEQHQLAEIRYNYNDYGNYTKIVFEGNNPREDMHSEAGDNDDFDSQDVWPIDAKELNVIKIYDQNNILNKTFNLHHHYMNGLDMPESNPLNPNYLPLLLTMNPSAHKRLVLDSITEVGRNGTSKPPYVFTYNPTILPNRHSNSKDYWGYYNGADNGQFLVGYGIDRRVDTTLSEAAMLKKITYPTGGSTRFTYEHNQGYKGSEYDSIYIPPVNPSKSLSFTLSNLAIANVTGSTYNSGGLYGGGFYRTEAKTVTAASIVRLGNSFHLPPNNGVNQMDACVGSPLSGGPFANCNFRIKLIEVTGSAGNEQPVQGVSPIYFWSDSTPIWINPGKYWLEVDVPGGWDPNALASTGQYFNVHLLIDDQVADDSILYAAGKRIKQIEFLDSADNVVSKKTYDYNNSGVILGIADFSYTINVGGVEHVLNPYHLFNHYQGNTIGYKYVDEYFGDETNNHGKRSYEFLVTKDSGNFIERPRTPPTDNEWLRGLPVLITDYKHNNNGTYKKVKQIENTYLSANDVHTNVLEEVVIPSNTLQTVPNDPSNTILTPETIIIDYESEYIYGIIGASNFPQDLSDSFYEDNYFYEKTKTNFRMPFIWTVFDYGANSLIDPTLTYLDNRVKLYHFTGGTIDTGKTVETLYDENESPTLVTETETAFNYDKHYQASMVTSVTSDGEPVVQSFTYPQEQVSNYEIHPVDPNTNQVTYSTDPITALAEQHRFVPLETKSFKDANDNKVADLGEETSLSKTVFEWFPNAQIQDVLEPALIQTGKDTDPSNITLSDRIEFKDYDADGNVLQVSKTNGMDICYIYGYDNTLPVAKIENATYAQVSSYVTNIKDKSNLDNDRTIDIINPNGSKTYIGKEGDLREALDILRKGLPNAMVTTYTYDPLIGITSMTNPNGYTVYYEYDDLNRLVRVKDADGKIMSENKYHYLLDN